MIEDTAFCPITTEARSLKGPQEEGVRIFIFLNTLILYTFG